MTNYEKFKDKINEILIVDGIVALKNGEPAYCIEHGCRRCRNCEFLHHDSCRIKFLEWLFKEYVEPAPTLTSKERAFCETVSVYPNRYIARDKDGMLKLFCEEPIKISHLWDIDSHGSYFAINETLFPFIKWKDEEPWSIEDLLKLEVE